MSAMNPTDLGQQIREARRQMALTQASLATQLKIQQSQISQIEKGKSSSLSSERLRDLLLFLHLDPSLTTRRERTRVTAVCSNPHCRLNIVEVIHGELIVYPTLIEVDASVQRHCRECNETLLLHCEGCKAPITEGSFCSTCRKAYVPAPELADLLADLELQERLTSLRNRATQGQSRQKWS